MDLIFNDPVVFLFRPPAARNTFFLDRDGILNHVVMRGEEISSPRCRKEFRIADDIAALASADIIANWNLVVISNQPDLSRGKIDIEFLRWCQEQLNARIPVNAIYVCPHQSVHGCACRKPGIGLLRRYRADHSKHNGQEVLLGDRINDQQCAANAGIPFILCRRDYNQELAGPSKYVVNNLNEIASLLKRGLDHGF